MTDYDATIKALAILTASLSGTKNWEWAKCYDKLNPRYLSNERSLADLTLDAHQAALNPDLKLEAVLATHKAIPNQGNQAGPTPPSHNPAKTCRDCGHLSHICACGMCECGALRQQPHAADCGVRA